MFEGFCIIGFFVLLIVLILIGFFREGIREEKKFKTSPYYNMHTEVELNNLRKLYNILILFFNGSFDKYIEGVQPSGNNYNIGPETFPIAGLIGRYQTDEVEDVYYQNGGRDGDVWIDWHEPMVNGRRNVEIHIPIIKMNISYGPGGYSKSIINK